MICLVPGRLGLSAQALMQLLPSHWQVQPVAKSRTCPRHTQGTLTRLDTEAATDKSQQQLHIGLTSDTNLDSHILSSFWPGRGRRCDTAHTQHSSSSQAHVQLHIPQAPSQLLCCLTSLTGSCPVLSIAHSRHSLAGAAGCLLQTCSTHTGTP